MKLDPPPPSLFELSAGARTVVVGVDSVTLTQVTCVDVLESIVFEAFRVIE